MLAAWRKNGPRRGLQARGWELALGATALALLLAGWVLAAPGDLDQQFGDRRRGDDRDRRRPGRAHGARAPTRRRDRRRRHDRRQRRSRTRSTSRSPATRAAGALDASFGDGRASCARSARSRTPCRRWRSPRTAAIFAAGSVTEAAHGDRELALCPLPFQWQPRSDLRHQRPRRDDDQPGRRSRGGDRA